jgi:cobalt-zinc-cadmium efflux system outer membrane protein
MLARAREVRDITQYAYQRGEASFVELLDAERAYMETVQSYTMARAEHGRSLYLIDAVSGKGGQR